MDNELGESLTDAEAAAGRGDHRLGADLLAGVVVRAEQLGQHAEAADALAQLALNQTRLGELVAATASGHRALAHCAELPASARSSRIHSTLSLAYERAGLHTFAVSHATRALEVARACQDLEAECWALNRLGTASQDTAGNRRGLDTLSQAVIMARRLPAGNALFGALNNLSRRWVVEADRLSNHGEDPEPALSEALPLAEEASQLPGIQKSAFLAATSMANLAGIHRRLGQAVQARAHFRAALEISQHHGYDGLTATVRLALACLDVAGSPSPRTRQAVQQLIDAEPMGMGADPDLLLDARRTLVRGYRESDDLAAALAQMERLNEALLAAQARRVDLQSRLLFNQAELDQARHRTDVARYEAQLQRMRADTEHLVASRLEREVAARTAELEHAKAAAESASRAKSRFLATVSHELHTPLNGLIGMVELAARRAVDPRQIDQLRKAVASAWQLNTLFDSMLDVVATDADAPALPVDTALRALLEGCRQKRLPAAKAKGIEVLIEVADNLPDRIHVDGGRVSRIVDALLDNAIKFSTQGPVRLSARRETEHSGRMHLRLAVQDHGPGVPPEVVERLFQPFEMGDDSATRKNGGLGLGLALAQRLAASLGGTVGIDTTVSTGSCFWLRLDLSPA